MLLWDYTTGVVLEPLTGGLVPIVLLGDVNL